jgi:hypothetical protein
LLQRSIPTPRYEQERVLPAMPGASMAPRYDK